MLLGILSDPNYLISIMLVCAAGALISPRYVEGFSGVSIVACSIWMVLNAYRQRLERGIQEEKHVGCKR